MIAIRRLDSGAPDFAEALERLTRFESTLDERVERVVAEIIADVRARGDAAVVEYTNRFDRQRAASIGELLVDAKTLAAAHRSLPAEQREALEMAARRIRVATKYTAIASEHFANKGVHVDLIKLYGSMELAPLSGLADAIVDLVSSGRTLSANDLVVVEDILPISARLIVNPAALKLKRDAVQPLLDAMAKAVVARRGATR